MPKTSPGTAAWVGLAILAAVLAAFSAEGREPGTLNGPPWPAFEKQRAARLTRAAAILAGMRVEASGPGSPAPSSPVWQDYCRSLDKTWDRLEVRQFSKVRRWAAREIAAQVRTSAVYYPFSGPDFLYPALLFPRAETYILTGLEPVGDFDAGGDASEAELEKALALTTLQLQDILGLTFFRTNDLKAAQESGAAAGILFAFLARTGYEILDACHVYIGREGALHVVAPDRALSMDPGLVPGLSILFRRRGESVSRRLFYFSMDLSNAGMKKHPEYVKFLKEWPQPATYLKATSFLLHYRTFSTLRRLILELSAAVLQDDSGIPLNAFEPGRWDMTYFGHYVGPIDMFSEFFQPELRDAFLTPAVRPLDFGIGYRFKPKESVLMLAVARTGAASQGSGPAPSLVRVTAGGTEAEGIFVADPRPLIGLEFSGAVPPGTVSVSLAGSSGSIPIDVAWEAGGWRAVGRPAAALPGHEDYAVVVDGLRPGPEKDAPAYAPEWRFRVLEQPAPAFKDPAIVIDRKTQQVFLCGQHGVILKTYRCATGSYYPKRGVFRVSEKIPTALSLFDDSRFSFFTVFQISETGYKIGLHSIPVFPDGRKAGDVGLPNSHGCVRLVYEDAKFLYDWARVGTRVVVD